ncbi:hypothetical protein Sjap_019185 [Stephania japonica]|uniref:Uncharacterized protein n=1 Tax=Stephania japonica TaxID=461633 RepID=A0AAP0EYB6_9MAGN
MLHVFGTSLDVAWSWRGHDQGSSPTARNYLDLVSPRFKERDPCFSKGQGLFLMVPSRAQAHWVLSWGSIEFHRLRVARPWAFVNPKTDEIDNGSSRKHLKYICPLCRGDISDWIVVEGARNFMNSKTRSCASETCNYSGTYADLRRHARLVHPHVRPFDTDPERERRWTRMEQERDFGDLFSAIQSAFNDDENIEEDNFMVAPFMNAIFVFRSHRAPSSSTMEAISSQRSTGTSGGRQQRR